MKIEIKVPQLPESVTEAVLSFYFLAVLFVLYASSDFNVVQVDVLFTYVGSYELDGVLRWPSRCDLYQWLVHRSLFSKRTLRWCFAVFASVLWLFLLWSVFCEKSLRYLFLTKTIFVVKKALYNSSSVGCFGFCFDHNRFWLFGHQTFWLVPITSLSFWRRLISHSRKNNTRSLCQFCLRCSGLKEDEHLILIWYRLVGLNYQVQNDLFFDRSIIFVYHLFLLRFLFERNFGTTCLGFNCQALHVIFCKRHFVVCRSKFSWLLSFIFGCLKMTLQHNTINGTLVER